MGFLYVYIGVLLVYGVDIIYKDISYIMPWSHIVSEISMIFSETMEYLNYS